MDSQDITFRKARQADLPAIVRLLAQDELGHVREDPSDPLAVAYLDAFQALEADRNQFLAVAATGDGQVVGTLQLSFIPGISRLGAWRGQIEAVRVAHSHRNAGLGHALFDWAISQCRDKGCSLVQLTTDQSRTDAHRFYEKLGFEASHLGYKLKL